MLFLAVFILSCSDEHNKLMTIDVADSFENQMEVKLSEFVTGVTYIPLETIKESYISDYPSIKVGDYKLSGIQDLTCHSCFSTNRMGNSSEL